MLLKRETLDHSLERFVRIPCSLICYHCVTRSTRLYFTSSFVLQVLLFWIQVFFLGTTSVPDSISFYLYFSIFSFSRLFCLFILLIVITTYTCKVSLDISRRTFWLATTLHHKKNKLSTKHFAKIFLLIFWLLIGFFWFLENVLNINTRIFV